MQNSLRNLRTKRDHLASIGYILEAIERYPNYPISRQCSISGAGLDQAKATIEILATKGYLRAVQTSEKRTGYHITTDGLRLLNNIRQVYEAISKTAPLLVG
jgi:predicted transcriptional regulator